MSVLELGNHIRLLPVIHGSGDFALAVRRQLLEQSFDCLAVPLPPSLQPSVEQAIQWLPTPTVVVDAPVAHDFASFSTGRLATVSCVPIDPCQAVIAALRLAMGEHVARAFIDLEVSPFRPYSKNLPDPYALKRVTLERFSAAVLPSVPPLPHDQARRRVQHMAQQLRQLEQRYRSIVCLCSVLDWPWLRDAYYRDSDALPPTEALDEIGSVVTYHPEARTLLFLLGELPFVTGLFERARRDLENDEHLTIDGVKELLITARSAYRQDFQNRSRTVTPQTLSTILKFVRNLTLLDRRLTPDLYNLIVGAKHVVGDGFALHVAEQAREYPFLRETPFETATLGIGRMRRPDGRVVRWVSRLPGHPVVWRTCRLLPKPSRRDRHKWQMRWNPLSQCSWPPEDKRIEDFRAHVAQRALAIMGVDLAKTEKFTTSIQDGIDIRETLRNWHTGDLYVKLLPPSRGRLDCVVMLFDSPADPRDYPWRTTWFAEHQNESTLAFFATDFQQQMVGPGIAMGIYGGALFLFPPVSIPDIWHDSRLDFTTTLEERMLAAACLHAECPQIGLLSPLPPGAGWRRLARRFGKKWVHVPLNSFSQSTIQQLRIVHVLNGHQVRSYAADFIRKA